MRTSKFMKCSMLKPTPEYAPKLRCPQKNIDIYCEQCETRIITNNVYLYMLFFLSLQNKRINNPRPFQKYQIFGRMPTEIYSDYIIHRDDRNTNSGEWIRRRKCKCHSPFRILERSTTEILVEKYLLRK